MRIWVYAFKVTIVDGSLPDPRVKGVKGYLEGKGVRQEQHSRQLEQGVLQISTMYMSLYMPNLKGQYCCF